MTEQPNILLAGTGAVGSYYGARLAQAGARVFTLCRSDYATVKKSGIKIKSVSGDYHFIPKQVVRNASDVSIDPDIIIVTTKVLPGISLPDLIGTKVAPETSIVLLQNGIGIDEPAKAAFPDNEIIGGIAFISVSRPEFGLIDHRDYGRIVLGRYPSGSSERTELLARLFRSAGVPCEISADIIGARWKKLLWNAPFNPMSVLCGGADTRELIESAPTCKLARDVMNEVIMLAEKAGHTLPRSAIDTIISDTRSMAPSKTSMLQDFEKKRPMEVEAILGNAIRIATELSLPVPHMESLYGLLTLVDMKNRDH
jgi:2-dehydropantoate 2-reductase